MAGTEKQPRRERRIVAKIGKALGILVLLAYEDLVILIWPGGPLGDTRAFAVILAADLAIGFDVFVRPSLATRSQKDEYATWKVYAFFVASPLLLGLPWIERDLLARRWLPEAALSALWWIGLAATLGGGVLLAWARLTLGRFGSPKVLVQEDHRLVTSGPYRALRNPMYAADLLLYCGVAIALGAVGSAAFAVAALLPMLVGRTRLEERLLAERFGDEYRAWAARTWRLVPFVW
ncbi:MAG: isoprenylcysteine carboxylmethyltransferase family protein [Spirochaetia bacterium]|nr:isoprenylcysteine carboxylmethyltransferase family protein [Spirochaetia bacterium]